jgi:hypothetical protein
MDHREKTIQDYFERHSYKTEWARLPAGGLFLLAWKGKQVEIIFLDLTGGIEKTSEADVKEEFLNLLSHLCRWSQWERVFKGREVLFKWLAWASFSHAQRRILEMAGVEPLEFSRFSKDSEEGKGMG